MLVFTTLYYIHLGKLQRPHCDLTGIMINKGNHPQSRHIYGVYYIIFFFTLYYIILHCIILYYIILYYIIMLPRNIQLLDLVTYYNQ